MTNATAVSVIAAMITPALLILASASLVASALVRMARIVDRARVLAAGTQDGSWVRLGATPDLLRVWLDRHATRARYAELSIALLYAAIVVFTATSLSIVLDREAGGALSWLPVVLAIGGTLLLLAGGTWMVVESRLAWAQIGEEIRHARGRLKEET
jgi:uncharacterized protein DUF2721